MQVKNQITLDENDTESEEDHDNSDTINSVNRSHQCYHQQQSSQHQQQSTKDLQKVSTANDDGTSESDYQLYQGSISSTANDSGNDNESTSEIPTCPTLPSQASSKSQAGDLSYTDQSKIGEKKSNQPSKELSRYEVGGIKSRPIKFLKHPLERPIISYLLLSVFFTTLAMITGIPVVLTLTLFMVPFLLIKKCLLCRCRSLPETFVKVTPIEWYWLLSRKSKSSYGRNNNNINDNNNNSNDNSNVDQTATTKVATTELNNPGCGVSTCLLFMDKGFSIDQLRDVIMARVIQKEEMDRFRSVLTYQGLSRTPFWSKMSYEEFSIEKQIINDRILKSKADLKQYLIGLMNRPLPGSLPPWQIRRCYASYLNQVILILRFHQSVIDGTGLAKILVQNLADQSPPKTTTFIRTTQGTTAATGYFKPRFGGINFTINLVRAIIVGPLTFSLWVIWAFTKRKGNYLIKRKPSIKVERKSSSDDCANVSINVSQNQKLDRVDSKLSNGKGNEKCSARLEKSVYWTCVELAKIQRVKQVARSCLNDVILAAIAGAVRQNMISKNITNPPNIGISLPVDIRGINDFESGAVGVKYVVLTVPLPTSIEGAIPRLWEIRHNMEELKASADPAVMYGAHYYLHSLLPGRCYRVLLNLIHRNSSVNLSNLQGPSSEVTIGTHRLRKILFWMSPPPAVSVTFNTISYGGQLFVSVSSNSTLLPCAKSLAKGFKNQLNQLSELLSKRRVPGEGRSKKRNPHYLLETPFTGNGPYLTRDLAAKLNQIQLERYHMNELLESNPIDRDEIEYRLEELKDEFADLMKQLRRRKSMAEYAMHNITINVEDNLDEDDMDGELRPPLRRFSFAVASRRSSVASAISIPSSRFQVSPPNLSRRYISSSPEPSSPPESFIKEETV